MTTPANVRRRVLRPERVSTVNDVRKAAAYQRLRTRLTQDQNLLKRWMARLKRAFHAVEKLQSRVSRSERQIARLG